MCRPNYILPFNTKLQLNPSIADIMGPPLWVWIIEASIFTVCTVHTSAIVMSSC